MAWWGEDLLYGPAKDEVWSYGTVPVTYERMREEVAWHRRVLRYHGIGCGTSVALLGLPSFTQLWTLFSLWSLGAQPILFPPRIGPTARVRLLESLRPQFVLTFGGVQRRRTFSAECEVLVRRLSTGRPATTPHFLVQLSANATVVGRTPESLLAELDRLSGLAGMPQQGDPVLLLDSWTSSFGLICGVLHATRHGAPLVLPLSVDPLVTSHEPRVVVGAPRHFAALCATTTTAMTSLRCAVSYGELLPVAVFDAFARHFGVRIGQVYGTTESGAIAADLSGRQAPPYVGTSLPGVRTRDVDGELHVHIGHDPYLTERDRWHEGWLSTGDLVSRDPDDGGLRLLGRMNSATQARADEAVDRDAAGVAGLVGC